LLFSFTYIFDSVGPSVFLCYLSPLAPAVHSPLSLASTSEDSPPLLAFILRQDTSPACSLPVSFFLPFSLSLSLSLSPYLPFSLSLSLSLFVCRVFFCV